mgnify:CR=1 FL=1
MKPLFPGSSEIDQINKIFKVIAWLINLENPTSKERSYCINLYEHYTNAVDILTGWKRNIYYHLQIKAAWAWKVWLKKCVNGDCLQVINLQNAADFETQTFYTYDSWITHAESFLSLKSTLF